MSQPRHPGPGEAAPETLLGDLISYYQEEAGAGRLRVCRQAALTRRAQAHPEFYLPEPAASNLGATHSQGVPSPTRPVCHELVQALEFLELISVNLLLFPWRKEIQSLKTYTGNFAYRVQPVLPQQTLHTILGRLGYVATSETEFSLVRAISKEDAKQLVFEIFLARVTCETILRTSSRQVLGPGREKPSRPYHRRSSETKLVKSHNCQEGVQPGPPEGLGSERALAGGSDRQSTVPMALMSLPEVSTSRLTSCAGPPRHLASQRHASTRSDSEEFLTCYSDLILHRTPLFPQDFPMSSLNGDQVQVPAPAPSPPPGEGITSLGSSNERSLVPSTAPESRVVPIPGQPCLTPVSQSSGRSLDPKPEAQPELATTGADTVPPNISFEMDKLCEHLSHLLRPPTLARRTGDFPGPGVEDNGQSEPLMGPDPATKAGSPDSRVIQLWSPTQTRLMYESSPTLCFPEAAGGASSDPRTPPRQ